MSLAIVHTRAQLGVNAPPVSVEAHLSNGLPGFTIVGLPETAVKESKDRVRSAILNSHFEFPAKRITINLAPADLPKEGGRFDLAIAVGILAASEQVPATHLKTLELLGELALTGELRPVKGSVASVIAGRDAQRASVLPKGNEAEASLCSDATVYVADSLLQVCAHLHERETMQPATGGQDVPQQCIHDMSDIKGQAQARRALEVAAAGGHNLLFFGPPGAGKSMLASRMPGILPPLPEEQALEVAAVHSVAGQDCTALWRVRPFRSPHHTSSAVSLVGGGSNPKPGEITLAHRGVLFLDELPEFPRSVLEVLREPLETGEIHVSRAQAQVTYPARFQLIAAMNPCPCGYAGDSKNRCRCTPAQVERYKSKISGPLLDRIDMHVGVQAIPISELQDASEGECSASILKRTMAARELQWRRQGKDNAQLNGREIDQHCRLNPSSQALLSVAMERLQLSARAYHRILRVSRTLADLQNNDAIESMHVSEAIAYRMMDRGSPS